jgi:hypothetical protein
MKRRQFLGSTIRSILFGAALSTGLGRLSILQINQYGVLLKYMERKGKLYGDGIPPEIKELAFEQVSNIAEIKHGKIMDFDVVHVPAGKPDTSDPLGQVGYFGIKFHLEEAA